MLRLHSKIEEGVLLHIINRKEDIVAGRADICPDEEYLQVSCFAMAEGKTFRPHYHVHQERSTDITQESWVVIEGRVQVTLYDLDHSVLHVDTLQPGDCSITFRGGHTYTALCDDTVVYEYKTGPYRGRTKDKAYL